MGQPLVARHVLRDADGPHDARRSPMARGRSRSRSISSITSSRSSATTAAARAFALGAAVGRRVLPAAHGRDGRARSSRADPQAAERDCRRDSRSTRTRRTARTIANTPTASGGCWCRPIACSRQFRAGFLGKCSPVHLFWGGLDLAVTRFSGRPAPPHPGRHPEPAGLGHARGVLARSEQLRLLARRRTDSARRLLCLRLSGAGRLSRRPPSSRAGRSTAPTSASSSCRTTSSASRRRPTRRCARFSSHLRGRSRSGQWDRSALERVSDPRRALT